MINHTFGCIFVHIPKTAGNSVNRVFGVDWENHKDLARYAAELPPALFASYYKFAIVRNPWERIFSDYNYQRKKSRDSKLFVCKDTGEKRCFREWLEAALHDPHRYAPDTWGGEVSSGIHRWSPQVDWLRVNGEIAVDAIIRMESLDEGFREVCAALGRAPVALPHRNSRFHFPYAWYYDDAAKRIVADTYAEDIELFGYRFGSEGKSSFSFSRKARPSRILTPSLITSSCSP